MTIQTSLASAALGRRGFIASGAAVAGGFSLGFAFPYASAQAADVQEINAWVVIKPDDTVVIRIARSEMGQGTLTGLAQLVAEELECDWSKVTTEYPTPGQSAARKRVWGSFNTGGSTGIRLSLDGYLGFTAGWVEGLEVNFLGVVFGIDLRRPAIKLPGLGRIGLAQTSVA